LELKDYQQRVLDTFDAYLDALAVQRDKAVKVIEHNASVTDADLLIPLPDYPFKAWDSMRAAGRLPAFRAAVPYSPRTDGTGAPVPNVCLKIPTGGGKTLLATAAVSRILGRYLSKNCGFVLWIVPNEAIYSQTKKQLSDREHPYRQMLDRAAAGRVKILEKESRLDRREVDTHLCVMLLMLQSANRETKETLRLFRDRGSVHGFFPNESDHPAHRALIDAVPNLDGYADPFFPVIKDSLGNVLRLIRPVVVMDEGHKAYSAKAIETLHGFNPCFVLELSATPKDRPKDAPPRFANWLVDVRGKELADEEMIKLPVNVKVKSGDDWRDALRESLDLLNRLQGDADRLSSETARYIRPILLVQVERTGKEQRESGFIHAEDAREFLLAAGLSKREIAVKTSEVNDLKDPEKQDLLSPLNPVRVIVTKQALQEGWDCPFAYVLCSLSANRNLNAMTQLVGRILRQPQAARTGIPALDECHVICHHAQTREVVASIKDGLEKDGMADLAEQILAVEGDGGSGIRVKRKLARRPAFDKVEIFLPVVNRVEGKTVRPLDYEQDVLQGIDWSGVDMSALAAKIPNDGSHVEASQAARISMTDGSSGDFFDVTPTDRLEEKVSFDPVYATRIVTDIVPNPWMARMLVGDLLRHLHARGFDESALGAMSGFLLEELRRSLMTERDRLAEARFMADVAAGRIQFRLRTDRGNWRMPNDMDTELPENAKQLYRPDGKATERSLFVPAYQGDFNGEEADFACYLDGRKAVSWWHRNVARAGQYHLQGWRKNKVYPDFIFAMTGSEGERKLVVIETKGDQLAGNLDTEYKRKLLALMNGNFRFESVVKAGELEIVDGGTSFACDLVLMSEWKTKLPAIV
jgi:type III restriction enzyme